MKWILGSCAALLALFAVGAQAVDVTSSVRIEKAGKIVFKQTNEFVGMSASEAADLNKSGMKVLDLANKHAERKGCDYAIFWNWSEGGKDQPEVVTQNMCFGGVNATMKQGTKWLNDIAAKSEKQEQAKKGRPWGNN
jgi:hypothetical protein